MMTSGSTSGSFVSSGPPGAIAGGITACWRGHPPKVGRGRLDEVDAHGMLSWQGSGGFSIDASVHIDGEDRAAVEIPILTM